MGWAFRALALLLLVPLALALRVTVTGSGTAYARPDTAKVYVTCEVVDVSLRNAFAKAKSVLKELTSNLPRANVYVTNFSSGKKKEVMLYYARYDLMINVSLSNLKKTLEALNKLRACRVNGITFALSQKAYEKAYKLALRKALDDALNKLKVIEDALNATKVALESVKVGSYFPALSAARPSPEPLVVRASVTVTAALG